VTDKQTEAQPAAVAETPKQARDIRARWAWVEPSVWTEPMLTALEEGVKGGKWFSLMDKVYRERTLWAAFQQVKANDGAAGVDHQSVQHFERDVMKNLKQLSEQLQAGTYRPQAAVRRVWIPKPGSTEERPLGVPTVRDRVVQAATRMVLEPIFERDFAEQSYGFRPNRGCKDALRRVDELLKQGDTWIVDADLKSYLDTASYCPQMKRPGTEWAEYLLL
jgi:RNA-directed DNA polymerase